MPRRLATIAWIGCCVALVSGCSKQGQTPPAAQKVATAPSRPAAPPLTIEEGQKWGAALEAALIAGDRDKLSELINLNALLDRSVTGLECPAETLRGMKSGAMRAIDKPNGFLGQLIALTQQGGTVSLLNVQEKEGQCHAMFRVVLSNSALNYHNYQLYRNAAGQVQADDIYVFVSGELLSDTLRQLFRQAIGSQGLLDKLSGKTAEHDRAWKTADEFLQKAREGKGQEALALFAKLPADMKRTKGVLLMRLKAAQLVNDNEYLQAIEDFRVAYPHDPALDLLLIDKYMEEKKFDRAEKCVDHLDEAVGGDPYLDFMRANLDLSRDRKESALEWAERGTAALPDLQLGYWTQIGIALQLNDFERVGRLLNEVSSRFHLEIGDLSKLPDYAGFVAWPGYQDWLRTHQAQGTKTAAPQSAPKGKAVNGE